MDFRFDLNEEETKECEQFARNSAGTQREYRSGGTLQRSFGQIFGDTWRGKTGEVISKKFLEQGPLNVEGIELDFDIYPRGEWDKTDMEINGKIIAIKSAKWFSKWLLLESKDIRREDVYDYYILVLINEDCTGGKVAGYATKNEIVDNKDGNTLKLKKGENIPHTSISLDANNHARHKDNLHNSENDWIKLVQELNRP